MKRVKKEWNSILLTLALLLGALISSSAQAGTLYWMDATASTWGVTSSNVWSDTSGVPGTLAWVNGSDAVFEGTTTPRTISVGATTNAPTVANASWNGKNYTMSSSGRVLTLAGDSSSTSTFSVGGSTAAGAGVKFSATIAGAANLTKAGIGDLVFNVANTYTGNTAVSDGTLVVRNNSGLSSGGVTVNAGATLAIGNGSSAGTTINNAITINGMGYGGIGALKIDSLYSTVGMTNTFSGPVTLGSAARINNTAAAWTLAVDDVNNAGYDLTVGGNGAMSIGSLVGAGSLILDGANTLTLSQLDLADTSSVSIASGAILNLGFGGTDTIHSLYLDGVQMASGIYDVSNSGGYITGTGSLTVVPEPNTLILCAAGLFGLLAYAWRKRK